MKSFILKYFTALLILFTPCSVQQALAGSINVSNFDLPQKSTPSKTTPKSLSDCTSFEDNLISNSNKQVVDQIDFQGLPLDSSTCNLFQNLYKPQGVQTPKNSTRVINTIPYYILYNQLKVSTIV